jgi:aspartate/methionine/tyrosine aminotransferase
VVPGSAFEFDPFVRVSYASSAEQMAEAARRLAAACATLSGAP